MRKALLALVAVIIVLGGVFAVVRAEVERQRPQNTPEAVAEVVEPPTPVIEEPEDILDANIIFDLVNDYRVSQGLPALKRDTKLDASAMAKCLDMQQKDYIAHVSPDGTEPWYFIKRAGVEYESAGENIAFIATVDEQKILDAWVTSESHRTNIVKKAFSSAGMAVCLENPEWSRPGDTKLTVQHFAG